jgi:hypothetical protein
LLVIAGYILTDYGEYSVTGTHTHPLAIVTNAPHSFLWDIMRKWVASGTAGVPRCESDPKSGGYAILHGWGEGGGGASAATRGEGSWEVRPLSTCKNLRLFGLNLRRATNRKSCWKMRHIAEDIGGRRARHT